MSDILIKGTEMPKSCFECPFRRKVDPDNIMCIVTREVFEETFAGTIKTRNRGNCPLVPVPPHGRLIDADDAICHLFNGEQCLYSWDEIEEAIDATETIIPADDKDTDVPIKEEGET